MSKGWELACVMALVLPATGHARTGTGTLTAQASVNSNCTITTAPVTFGTYDSIVLNRTAPLNSGAGSVTIACVKGSAPSITLGIGLHSPDGSARRMVHATNTSEFLTYELYQPPNNAAATPCTFPTARVWGTRPHEVFSPTAAPDKNSRSYSVCATVPPGQNVEVGNYADMVVATVTF